MSDYELELELSSDNPHEISLTLHKIAGMIDKGIYVHMYDPVYSMTYPGSIDINDDSLDMCEVCKKDLFEEERCICEYGHLFCEKHLVNTDDPEFGDEEDMDDVPSKYCPICDDIQNEKDMKRCSD